MDIERSIEYYDSHVKDLKLEDITSDEYETEIFRKLRDDDPDLTKISLNAPNYGIEDDDFGICDDDDLGWLGYFIGRSSQLNDLTIFIDNSIEGDPGLSLPQMDALAQGISLNRSISWLTIVGDLGDLFLQRLGHFFRGNKNLLHLRLSEFDIGLETARNLAVDLRDMSLKSFDVERLCYDSDSGNFIDDGTVTEEVITALSTHKKLHRVELLTCNLNRSSCMALGRLSSLKKLGLFGSSMNNVDAGGIKALTEDMLRCLESLEISCLNIDYDKAVALSSGLLGLHSLRYLSLRKSIGDDALQYLVAAIERKATLEWLDVSHNTSITVKGLSSFSILLQSERCSLKYLDLSDMHIGDDGAAALAEVLARNKSLKRLEFSEPLSMFRRVFPESGITATGWSAFARLLCDTSSINNTYLSNHTLEMCTNNYRWNTIGNRPLPVIAPPDVECYLALNRDMDHKHASMYKILLNHPDFDMKPLFQWQLKFLPLMVAWFKTARSRRHKMRLDAFTSTDSLRLREISAIFQFMRGLPLLAVSGYLDQKMIGAQSKKRKQTNVDSYFNQVERPLQRRNVAQETNEQAE